MVNDDLNVHGVGAKGLTSSEKTTLDTVKTNTDTIKTYTDSIESTLGTVNTNVNTVKANTDTLESSVGSDADTASATGSVHAKLKDIKSGLGSTSGHRGNGSPILVYAHTPTNSESVNKIAIASVTGKGVLKAAQVYNEATGSSTLGYMEIIIDGVVYYYGASPYMLSDLNLHDDYLKRAVGVVPLSDVVQFPDPANTRKRFVSKFSGFGMDDGFYFDNLGSGTAGVVQTISLPSSTEKRYSVPISDDGIPFESSLTINIWANGSNMRVHGKALYEMR